MANRLAAVANPELLHWLGDTAEGAAARAADAAFDAAGLSAVSDRIGFESFEEWFQGAGAMAGGQHAASSS